jgi:hypothetical protein
LGFRLYDESKRIIDFDPSLDIKYSLPIVEFIKGLLVEIKTPFNLSLIGNTFLLYNTYDQD